MIRWIVTAYPDRPDFMRRCMRQVFAQNIHAATQKLSDTDRIGKSRSKYYFARIIITELRESRVDIGQERTPENAIRLYKGD